jgi:hypothetical protein
MAGLKPGNLGVASSFLSVVVCVVARNCFFKCKNWLTFRGGSLFEAASTSFRVLVHRSPVWRNLRPNSRAE